MYLNFWAKFFFYGFGEKNFQIKFIEKSGVNWTLHKYNYLPLEHFKGYMYLFLLLVTSITVIVICYVFVISQRFCIYFGFISTCNERCSQKNHHFYFNFLLVYKDRTVSPSPNWINFVIFKMKTFLFLFCTGKLYVICLKSTEN